MDGLRGSGDLIGFLPKQTTVYISFQALVDGGCEADGYIGL